MRYFILLVFILSVHALAFSDTIFVPGDYPTIQRAIDAAVNEDTVLVKPGTYVENINFMGKAITVKSSDGPQITTIDGGQKGSVVVFDSIEGHTSVLQGFTITNGSGTALSAPTRLCGAGIYCTSCPTISGNVITGNHLVYLYEQRGGGICCEEGAALICKNTIADNSAQYGGGIYCSSSVTITDNIITNNRVSKSKSYARGGGIYCVECHPVIAGNTITHNSATGTDPAGGGIFCKPWSSGVAPVIAQNTVSSNVAETGGGIFYGFQTGNFTPTIIDCWIEENFAHEEGGGIYTNAPDMVITNCSVLKNQAEQGGGIFGGWMSVTNIVNCTVHGNTAFDSGGGVYKHQHSYGVFIFNSIIRENQAGFDPEISGWTYPIVAYCNVKGGWPGEGNIDADPLFVDPENGDCHLTYLSPCKDTGDNAVAGLPSEDFEGDPRVAYGTVDMGADEFYTHLYVLGDTFPGGGVSAGFVGLPGATPVGLFVGTGVLPSPIPTMWGEYWLQAPWILLGPLGAIPADGIMVLPTRLPPGMTAPVDIPMQALIGLNADSMTNLCVLEVR